jgi:hypothetical protein
LTPGEDAIDTATWAGSVPQVGGIAARVRIGRSRWFNLLWLLPISFLLLIILIAVAKGLRDDAFMQRFIRRYPGTAQETPPAGTTGFPAWVDLQHFLNLFLMIFIIRAGVQTFDHPRLYWTRHSTPGRDWFRDPEAGPCGPVVDGQAGLDQPAGPSGPAGASPLHRAGPLVAPQRRRAMAAQRRRVLHPAVRHRPLAPPDTAHLGRVPQRPVDAGRAPVFELAG